MLVPRYLVKKWYSISKPAKKLMNLWYKSVRTSVIILCIIHIQALSSVSIPQVNSHQVIKQGCVSWGQLPKISWDDYWHCT